MVSTRSRAGADSSSEVSLETRHPRKKIKRAKQQEQQRPQVRA
jgi:hypothetical protein